MSKTSYDEVVNYMIENQNKFYRLAYRYTKNEEQSMDIVQNSICKALEKYPTIRDKNAIKTWFYKVLVNESLTFIKKNGKEILNDNETLPEEAYYEKAYEHAHELYAKVDQLSPEIKTVVMLHFYEDMTLKEISEITNTNLSTVKTRLYTGLKNLKEEIGGYHYES